MSTPATRVAVVGAGPVGQTAALALARWGVPVVLLDRRPARDLVGSKAICQQRDVLDFWSCLGAGRIAQEGLTWSRARTFHRDEELFCVDLPDPGRSVLPPFVNLSQGRTEQILDEAIAANPLVEVRWDREVVGLTQTPDEVQLVCATTGGQEVVRAAYAVACAGARGHGIRQLLGVDFPGESFADPFLICDIETTLPGWEHERRFYFDPSWNLGRQVLIHPCPGGIYRIDWQVEPTFDLETARRDGSLDRRIRQVIGERPYRLDWTSVYRFQSRLANRFAVGRVMLAGDLAHLLAPFGARGLNSGVADAENAAWKIAFALRGWAGPALVGSYEDERRAAATENVEVTSGTMSFLVPRSPEHAEARRALLEAARTDGGARARVDSGRLAEPYWYVESALTTAASWRTWPGRPLRGEAPAAVPGVVLPDGPVRMPARPDVSRVRQLSRDGFLALTGPAVDLDAARAALDAALGAVPHDLLAVDRIDPEGVLTAALDLHPTEIWLVRPDAHTCACVTDPAALGAAARRALGY